MTSEPREFEADEEDRLLDPCDEAQVEAWAARYAVPADLIRQACEAAGNNRVAVEIWLGEARL